MIVPISYVLKALKSWMEDVGLTPNIKFRTADSGVRIPEHLKDSEIIALNIGSDACRNFVIDDDNFQNAHDDCENDNEYNETCMKCLKSYKHLCKKQ